ncbi:hypothetical protein HanRHA438_Chr17g0820981 [Helianthus annuus]|nr:hypothetical protein HanIR_Chr17g0880001 [Helianthus annuus]KAJ0827025.1 hypothetical protein HanRHA438_Chr17g0820981 [Helianthus annuus]
MLINHGVEKQGGAGGDAFKEICFFFIFIFIMLTKSFSFLINKFNEYFLSLFLKNIQFILIIFLKCFYFLFYCKKIKEY